MYVHTESEEETKQVMAFLHKLRANAVVEDFTAKAREVEDFTAKAREVEDFTAPLKYVPGDDRLHAGNIPPERLAHTELTDKCIAMQWSASEIVSLSEDAKEYEFTLSDHERSFVDGFLCFFSELDGWLNKSVSGFVDDIKSYDIVNQYSIQMAVEVVHQKAYAMLLDGIIKDPKKRDALRNSTIHFKSIGNLVAWLSINSQKSHACDNFAKRILINIVLEGIMFAGAFACVYYLDHIGIMTTLAAVNGWIARDENTHVQNGYMVYDLIKDAHKLDADGIRTVLAEMVPLAKAVNHDICTFRLKEINADLLDQYTEYITDGLCDRLEIPRLFNVSNPFVFMENIRFDGNTNTFERTTTEYEKNGDAETFDYGNYSSYLL